MPFIGTQPEVGGYSVLDALTASATASYTLQLNSANFVPNSANQLLVSLNGVIQKPGTSFTVSGSTLTFSSALDSSDSIDFILAMGEPLLVGTPSDGTVSTAKIVNNAVTVGKLATSGTLPALNGSALTSVVPEGPAFAAVLASTWTVSSNSATVIPFATELYDTDSCYNNSNYRFTPNVAGYYSVHLQVRPYVPTNAQVAYQSVIRKNGSMYVGGQSDHNMGSTTDATFLAKTALIAMNGSSDYIDFTHYQYIYTSPANNNVHSNGAYTWANAHLALKL